MKRQNRNTQKAHRLQHGELTGTYIFQSIKQYKIKKCFIEHFLGINIYIAIKICPRNDITTFHLL